MTSVDMTSDTLSILALIPGHQDLQLVLVGHVSHDWP